MKEKLTRNIGLKVLSIILAAIMWLVITNIDDPISPKSFTNINVKIVHEDAIKSLGLVYEILEGATIDFTVAAKRSIVDELTDADFEVTADFAKLSDVNAVTINIACPDEVTVTDGLYQVMKINKEELVDKNFKVTVVTQGDPAEGYYVGKKSASRIITVAGPKSKIERIGEIVAEVNVSGASGTFSSYERLKALDEEGEVLDASNLSFSENYVTINIDIYETKVIDLKITTTGSPANGYVISNVDFEPKSIEIAGDDKALDSISELQIEEDVTGARENIEKEVNIQEQLGEGLTLVGEDETAVIYITVEKTETKEIAIWPADIEIRNMPLAMDMTYLTTGPIILKMVGLADELTELSRNSIKPYINLKDYTYGTYAVTIQAELGVHTTIADNPTVSVYLTSSDSYDQ